MESETIKWNEGEGNIVATYEGSGNGPVSITCDIANEGLDRSQDVIIRTTKGNNPKEESVLVKQPGLREVFMASDGDFVLADGGTFNVLKSPIPNEYTLVEYVESTGTQYN